MWNINFDSGQAGELAIVCAGMLRETWALCLLESTEMDWWVSKVHVGQVRGPRIWAGVLDRRRSCAQGIHECMCLWTRSVLCALLSLPAQEEEETWLSVFMYLGAIENNTLFVVICVTNHVSVLCACVSGTHAHVHYWLNLHTGKKQLHPSTCPGPQGIVLGSVARQEGYLDQSSWKRQPCS